MEEYLHRYPGGVLSPFGPDLPPETESRLHIQAKLDHYLGGARAVAIELLERVEAGISAIEDFEKRRLPHCEAAELVKGLQDGDEKFLSGSRFVRFLDPLGKLDVNYRDLAAELETKLSISRPAFIEAAAALGSRIAELHRSTEPLQAFESIDAAVNPDPLLHRQLSSLKEKTESFNTAVTEITTNGFRPSWENRVSAVELLRELRGVKDLLSMVTTIPEAAPYSVWPKFLQEGFRSSSLNTPSARDLSHPGTQASEVLGALEKELSGVASTSAEELTRCHPREFIFQGLAVIEERRLLDAENLSRAKSVFQDLFASQDTILLELRESFGFGEEAEKLSKQVQLSDLVKVEDEFRKRPLLAEAIGPLCSTMPRIFQLDAAEIGQLLDRIYIFVDKSGPFKNLGDIAEFNPLKRPDSFLPPERLEVLERRAAQLTEMPDKIEIAEREQLKTLVREYLEKRAQEYPEVATSILVQALDPRGGAEGVLRKDILRILCDEGGSSSSHLGTRAPSRVMSSILQELADAQLVIATHRLEKVDNARYRVAHAGPSHDPETAELLNEIHRVFTKFAPERPAIVEVPKTAPHSAEVSSLTPGERRKQALIDFHGKSDRLYQLLFREETEEDRIGKSERAPDLSYRVLAAMVSIQEYLPTFRETLSHQDALAAGYRKILGLSPEALKHELTLHQSKDYLTSYIGQALEGTERLALHLVAHKLTGPFRESADGTLIAVATKPFQRKQVLHNAERQYSERAPECQAITELSEALNAFRKAVINAASDGIVSREMAAQMDEHMVRFWSPLTKNALRSREDFEISLSLFEGRIDKYYEETAAIMRGLGYSIWVRTAVAKREILLVSLENTDMIRKLDEQLFERAKEDPDIRQIVAFEVQALLEKGLISETSAADINESIGETQKKPDGRIATPELLPSDRLMARSAHFHYQTTLRAIFGGNQQADLIVGDGVAGKLVQSLERMVNLASETKWVDMARLADGGAQIYEQVRSYSPDQWRAAIHRWNLEEDDAEISRSVAFHSLATKVMKYGATTKPTIRVSGSALHLSALVAEDVERDPNIVQSRVIAWKRDFLDRHSPDLLQPFLEAQSRIGPLEDQVKLALKKGDLSPEFYERQFMPALEKLKLGINLFIEAKDPYVPRFNSHHKALLQASVACEKALRSIRSNLGCRINILAWSALAPRQPDLEETFLEAATDSMNRAYFDGATDPAEVEAWMRGVIPGHLKAMTEQGQITARQRDLMQKVFERVSHG